MSFSKIDDGGGMNRYTEATLQETKKALSSFKYVKISWERHRAVSLANACRSFALPVWDFPDVEPKSHKAFPSHCFFWNVINFCFDARSEGRLVKFEVEYPGKNFTGAYAMARCFYRVFGEQPITPEKILPFLRSWEKFRETFRGINEMPLLKERFEFLHEACDVLTSRFRGDVMNLIEEANHCAFGTEEKPGIVELIMKGFPKAFGQDWFKDDNHFFPPGGKTFYLLKRAQLFALMYHDRAVASDGALHPLRDAEQIGPIADYQLPKSYVGDGVLVYNKTLTKHIANALELPWHSHPEIEIRLAFVLAHAEELRLINEVRGDRGLDPIHIGHLDYYRWQRVRGQKGLNHHLTYTTDY